MKHLLIRGLALSLGLLATSARGQETVWRSTPATPGATTQGISAGKPIAIAVSRPATTQPTPPAAPAVSLGRPVAIAGTDRSVRPVSFSTNLDPARPIVRGAAPDLLARPMPSFGSASDPLAAPPTGPGNWRRPDDVVASPRTGTDAVASTPVAIGTSNGSGTTLPAPTPAPDPAGVPPAVVGQPVLSGPPTSLFATNGNCGCGVGGSAGPVVDCAPGCGCGKTFVGGRMSAGGGCATGGCAAGGGCATGGCGGGMSGLWGRYVEPMFAGMGDPDGGMDSPRLAINAEYLLWWMKGDRTPPLAVAVPTSNGLPAGMATTLIGGNSFATNAQSGARLSAVYWFSGQQCWGIDASGFFLGLQDKSYLAGGGANANPVIGRPFFDTSAGGAAALELVAGLGILQGTVEVAHRSTLWGYDINLRRNLVSDCAFTMDVLFGFRQLGLDESIRITENLTQTAAVGGFPAGSTFLVSDKFSTMNRFYGGQVGLAGLWRLNDVWSLGFTGKVAVGTTQQTVDINGSTTVTPPGGVSQTQPGGLLTQNGTNIGHYTRNRFGVVPEVGVTLGYQVTDWLRLTAGYNFLYWSNVVRPGDQINPNVNRTLLPFRGGTQVPGAQPAFLGRTTDYYAQGVTFGMLFTF